jgi:predicted transcriptional regulator
MLPEVYMKMELGTEIKNAVNWEAPAVAMDDSLRTVIQKMVAGKSSAVLVKTGDDVVGIMTDMDVLGSIARHDDLDETKVSTFMTHCELILGKSVKSPCVQLDAEQSLGNAIEVMNRAGIRQLVISGEKDKGAGMVSVLDLLKLAIS